MTTQREEMLLDLITELRIEARSLRTERDAYKASAAEAEERVNELLQATTCSTCQAELRKAEGWCCYCGARGGVAHLPACPVVNPDKRAV